MSITRKCGACKAMIDRPQCLELAVRVIWTDRAEDQDAVEELHDEYCDGCVADGRAVRDLLAALTKYRLGGADGEGTEEGAEGGG